MQSLTLASAIVVLTSVTPALVAAQDVASSFDQLRVLVAPGDKITIMDLAGREAQGRIGVLTGERLTLITPAGPRELAEAEIVQIRQRRGDSLQNGAMIGAAAGAGYGVAVLLVSMTMDDGGGPIPASVVTGMLLFTGLGAAAGAGIDALITRHQVIYRKAPGANRLSVSPIVGGGRRGVGVALRF